MKVFFNLLLLLIISSVIFLVLFQTGALKGKIPPEAEKIILYYKNKYLSQIPSLPVDFWSFEGEVIPEDYRKYAVAADVIVSSEGGIRMYSYGTSKKGLGTSIYSFYLPDGKKWVFEEERLADASMPSIVQLDDKRFRLYFKTTYTEGKTQYDALKSAVSDDGLKFRIEEGYRIITGKGKFTGSKTILNLEIVKINNGFRMYFSDGLDKKKYSKLEKIKGECSIFYGEKYGWSRILSAVSRDGLEWEYEGVRLDSDNNIPGSLIGFTDPTVISMNGMYRMYVTGTYFNPGPHCNFDSVDKELLFTSKDGLNFALNMELNIAVGHSEVVKADDKLHLYSGAGEKSYTQIIDKAEQTKNTISVSALKSYFEKQILPQIINKTTNKK